MTTNEQDLAALKRATRGNEEAMSWLGLWRDYVHRIDDIIDGDDAGSEAVLKAFALAVDLYTHPFFLKNALRLKQLVLNCTNAYADSVAWEKSKEAWQQNFSDHYRHFGAEMVLAVATICGGYDHARSISLELRTICWMEHHTKEGKVI
jgi:hypothetical protein